VSEHSLATAAPIWREGDLWAPAGDGATSQEIYYKIPQWPKAGIDLVQGDVCAWRAQSL
jgi:hypothetical protein